MAFTIQNLIIKTIRMPAFLGNRQRLMKEKEMETKLIAKARIHIKRFNEQLNKFLLVVRTLYWPSAKLGSQMVHVAYCPLDFQQPLCK